MKVIYKYPLKIVDGSQSLTLPTGSQILSVGMQGEDLMLWALVEPAEPLCEIYKLWVFCTGEEFPDSNKTFRFIGHARYLDPVNFAPLEFFVFQEGGVLSNVRKDASA